MGVAEDKCAVMSWVWISFIQAWLDLSNEIYYVSELQQVLKWQAVKVESFTTKTDDFFDSSTLTACYFRTSLSLEM